MNQDILKEITTTSFSKIDKIIINGYNMILEWSNSDSSQAVTKYQLAGKRNRGSPLKRLLGCNVETGRATGP
jgi:hypothetical protein